MASILMKSLLSLLFVFLVSGPHLLWKIGVLAYSFPSQAFKLFLMYFMVLYYYKSTYRMEDEGKMNSWVALKLCSRHMFPS